MNTMQVQTFEIIELSDQAIDAVSGANVFVDFVDAMYEAGYYVGRAVYNATH